MASSTRWVFEINSVARITGVTAILREGPFVSKPTSLTDEALIFLDNLADAAAGLVNPPAVRLGVTGLARAGKTVFITALVHNLIHGGRLPLFSPYAQNRIVRGVLQPQPNDNIPRFDYESHVAALTRGDRHWPQSTSRISELRLTIEYESASFLSRSLGSGRLNIDIVDYPGEWLLDLALLGKSYGEWSRQTLERAREPAHRNIARKWLALGDTLEPHQIADEVAARQAAQAFCAYLTAARSERHALSMLPPGRFLMPGDLAGSPALTFAPLHLPAGDDPPPAPSLYAMMARRYEAYKHHVVKPFFRQHFARLDRQIVLIDVLSALNAGPAAMADLEDTLAQTLRCFRPGPASWLTSVLFKRIDRILFAATKADHLHHSAHARLEGLMERLVSRARQRACFRGATVKSLALASVRATHEALAQQDGDELPCIAGTPLAGERIGGETFDGKTDTAIFPGDLPADPETAFHSRDSRPAAPDDNRSTLAGELAPYHVDIVRFRPAAVEISETGARLSLPHIRLDKALEFLLGDKLA